MKHLLLLFISLSFLTATYSQSNSADNNNPQLDSTQLGKFEAKIKGNWVIAEGGEPPRSENIDSNFDNVITSVISYPSQAMRMGIQGRTLIEITIDDEGKTIIAKNIYDVGAGTGLELQKVIPMLPTSWIPAQVNGKDVESRILVLIQFTLDDIETIEFLDNSYKCFIVTANKETINALDLGKKTKSKGKKREKKN